MLQERGTDQLGPQVVQVEGRPMLELLSNVSGWFRPGVLTALVGASGSSKTTLLVSRV